MSLIKKGDKDMDKPPLLPDILFINNIVNISYSQETRSLTIQTEQQDKNQTRYLSIIEIQPEALQEIVSALTHFASKLGKSIEDLFKPPTFQ
jgi:hypothetical protein